MRQRMWSTGVWGFVLVFALSSFAGATSAAAQDTGLVDDTTYVLETTGEEVAWDDPWVFDDEISETGDGFEIVALTGGVTSLLISVLPNGLDIEEARDIVLEEFESGTDEFTTIDRGAYENISYSLDLASIDGVELGVFTVFRGGSGDTPTFAYIFIGAVQGFADGITSAQDAITVGGDAIFNGVDGDGLQTQLEQNAGAAPVSDDDETPEADDETPEADETPVDDETPEDEETPDDDEVTPDDSDRETPDDDEATEASDDERGDPVDEELVELGVVEDGLYESPQFGTEVTWSSDWAINESVDEPVVSDTSGNVDILVLSDETDTFLSIQVQESGDVTPVDIVALWSSDEFLEGSDTAGTEPDEVVLDDASQERGGVVVLADLEDGTQIVVYREALLVDGGDTLVILQMFQVIDGVEDGVVSAQDSVEVDGEPVLTTFDAEDVVAAVE